MYSEFFGFSEKPFTITPNPHFIFLSERHRVAFERLLYGIENRAGFITMTGEVGTGKTTVLRTLLTRLDPEKYRSALIFNPCFSREQLLAAVCREFGVGSGSQDLDVCLETLERFLQEQQAAGLNVVLVVDEAQNLAPEVLEEIRLISERESGRSRVLQIILAGQPEMDEVLGRQELRQLSRNIAVRCQLASLGSAETSEYINHRVKVSGCRIPGLFTKGAVRRIFSYSKGIPRLINIACEQSLVVAWTRESPVVTADMVQQAVSGSTAGRDRSSLLGRLFTWLWAGVR